MDIGVCFATIMLGNFSVASPCPSHYLGKFILDGCGPGDIIHLETFDYGNVNYLWTGPDGFTSNLQDVTTTYPDCDTLSFYTLSVQVCGCWSTPDTVWVAYKIKPDLGPDISVCDTTQLYPLYDLLNNGYTSYLWNTASLDTTDTIYVYPSIGDCYIVTATDILLGCTGSDTVCFVAPILDTATVGLAQNCATGCYWPNGSITTNSTTNIYQFDFWGQGPPSQSDFNETTFSNLPTDWTNNYWCYGTDWGVYDIAVSITYGAGCVATDTMKLYHYDFTQMAGPDTFICPTLDSILIGNPILSTLPLASAAGPGFVINWKNINTGQTYLGQGNPWVSLLPGTTNAFELYVLNPYGCDYRDTIYITTCCYDKVGAPPVQIIPANTVIDNSTVIPGFNDVWIQGDVTISGDVLWQNLNVRMAPYSKIVIPPTFFLTPTGPSNYTRLVLDGTKIFADCDTMWTGIEVYGDSTNYDSTWAGLVHYRSSEIRDALIGIHSIDGGSFIVQKAKLFNNHNHITIAPFPDYFANNGAAYHPSFLDEAILDCRQSLLFPHVGERTNWAIFINQGTPVATRKYSNTPRTTPYYWPSISYGNNRSYIANADIGIYANNMQTEIEMIDFYNITCDPAYSNPCIQPVLNQRPTGIRFQGNHTPLYVDDCTFTGCDIGVNTIRTSYSEVKGSTFSNCKQFGVLVQSHDRAVDEVDVHHNNLDAGFIAINSVANNSASKINIYDNVITNSDRGIQFTFNPGIIADVFNNDISGGEFGIETFANQLAQFSVHDNTIDNTSRFGVMTRGISFTEASSNNVTLVQTVNNRIKARHIGIFLNGMGTGLRHARNRFNTIEMVPNIIPTFGLPPSWISMSNFGIYFLGTSSARATRNEIDGPLVYSTGVTDWQNNVRGICIDGSFNNQIFCNTLEKTRDGIQVVGGNAASRIIRNEYHSGRTALTLSVGALTGFQGNPIYESHDNEFHCQFTVSALRSENGLGNQSGHMVRNNLSNLYTPNSCVIATSFIGSLPGVNQIGLQNVANGYANFTNSTPPNDWCGGMTLRTSSTEEDEVEYPEAGDVLTILDSIPWDSIEIEEARVEYLQWENKWQMYQIVHNHDTLRDLSSRIDSFYLENDELSYGILRRATDYENSGYLEEALIQLNDLSEDDSLAMLYGFVKSVGLQIQLNNYTWDSIPSTTRDSLFQIAESCPLYYGHSVYLSRALISKFESHTFINECEVEWVDSVEIDSSYSPYVPSATCLNIYPNPGDEQVTVELLCAPEQEYSITVINNLGFTIDEHVYEENEPEYILNTDSWPQGVYHVILFQNGVYFESRLVAILH